MKKIILLFITFSILCSSKLIAEDIQEDHTYKPLTLKLDEKGEKYIRFITWAQIWGKYTETNPGYKDVNGNPTDATYDIGIRRARFLAMAQISPRFMILTHFGVNNQQFNTGGAPGAAGKKPQLYFHDVWTEYRVWEEYLYLGTGLHYWNGLSRASNGSTLNFMTLDAPIFNWPNIELTDQFARQFGVYAKGKFGKIDYRFALNKPFVAGADQATSTLNENLAINVKNTNFAGNGYVNYQFLDQESNKLPYMVGSYLGKKSIFNIGAGFYYHPEATGHLDNGDLTLNDELLLSADVFYERPIMKKYALSIYSVFYNFDFGPNYLRNIGIESGTGGTINANSQPMIGTGTIWYTQAGFLFAPFNKGNQLMPYITFTMKDFEALNETINQFDYGLNYFINGHNAKITLQYSTRPIIINGDIDEFKGELILQTAIFL